MEDTVGTLFLKDKQARLLTVLSNQAREWHITDLAREANVTYVHTSKFISLCEKKGIVAAEKHGRTKKLSLTKKGEAIAKNIAEILQGVSAEAEKPPQ
jgi:predicted transcriptional regulator